MNPLFDQLNTVQTITDPDIPAPPALSMEEATLTSMSQYSQKMKDLELWHQRLGHFSITHTCTPYDKSVLQMSVLCKSQNVEMQW